MLSKIFSAGMLAVASSQSIRDVVFANAGDDLTGLKDILQGAAYSDVAAALGAPGTYTVFAPTDAADFTVLSTDVEANKATLYYHVLGTKVLSTDLAVGTQFVNTLSTTGSNVVDGQALGVVRIGENVTLSFGIAEYTARVIEANIPCTNGIVHKIDKLLALPKKTSVVGGLVDLQELAKALVKADLVGDVDDTAKVTIFAPTDEAMIAAGWNTLPKEDLIKILKYHVVVGTVAYSTTIISGEISGDVVTYNGASVAVAYEAGKVMINDAEVTTPDALVFNGVVHIINKVLIPPTESPSAASVVTESPSAASVVTESPTSTEGPVGNNTESPTSTEGPVGNNTESPTSASSTDAPTTTSSAAATTAFAGMISLAVAVALA